MPVDINTLATLGVGAVIVIAILGTLINALNSYLAQRSLNDQLSLGVQGIVGVNNLNAIDSAQEKRGDVGRRVVRDGKDGKDGQDGSP